MAAIFHLVLVRKRARASSRTRRAGGLLHRPNDTDARGVQCHRKPVDLVSPSGQPVDALYFDGQRALTRARERASA